MPDNTNKSTNETVADATAEPIRVSDNADEASTVNRSEIIEVEWENVKHIFEFRKRLQDMENYFANMCLQFEKSKADIMSQITYGQNDLYSMAEQLQKSQNVDANLTYELKLPSSEGEKAYFLRKQE